MTADFRGSLVALVTPFKDGKVDEAAFCAHVAWQVDNGTHGLVPCGTTGESATLSHAEHKRVVNLCIAEAGGRVPVLAGAGSNNTAEAIDLAVHAESAGADGLLVVTPYYNRPNQAGLYAHFKAINDAVGIPIVIYNIPPRSAIDMSIETMQRLYELENIVGVKDATANLGRVSLQRQALGPDFLQLSGEDMTALAANAAGGHGCISVTANVAPRACADLQGACLRGDYKTALDVQDRLVPLHQALFIEPNPACPKYALSVLGRMGEDLRLPMVPVSEASRRQVRAAMVHAGLINE